MCRTEGAVRSLLLERGISWPAPIEHLACVGSTNDTLRERARAGAASWHVVIADRQILGRGREGRTWISAPGDLFLSVLLRPEDLSQTHRVLPLLAGIAGCEAAREWGLEARLKWPNDLLVGERKLAGILVEATSSGARVESLVLGIGVNLASDPPQELRGAATSVRVETGHAPAVETASAGILAALRGATGRYATQGCEAVVA